MAYYFPLAKALVQHHNSHLADGAAPADAFVVELAALLHDIFDAKYTAKTSPSSLREWLSKLGLADEKVDLVLRIVENVSFRKAKQRRLDGTDTDWHKTCVELHCVMDADYLDALGATGIARCCGFSCVKNVPFYAEGSADTAAGHFEEKLFHLPEYLHSDFARKIAYQRLQIMKDFVEALEVESKLLDADQT